jgi:hypothetical protein
MAEHQESDSPNITASTVISPLPPLSPYNYQSSSSSSSKRHGQNFKTISSSAPQRRGHRRALSEIPFTFSGENLEFLTGHGFSKNVSSNLVEGEKVMVPWPQSSTKNLDAHVKKELLWGTPMEVEHNCRTPMDRCEKEGDEDLFSMYIDVDKIDGYQSNPGPDQNVGLLSDMVGNKRPEGASPSHRPENYSTNVLSPSGSLSNHNSNVLFYSERLGEPSRKVLYPSDSLENHHLNVLAPPSESLTKGGKSIDDIGNCKISAEVSDYKHKISDVSDSDKEDNSDKEEGDSCNIGESFNGQGKNGFGHSRSASMDETMAPLKEEGNEVQSLPPGGGRQIHHSHSLSMDGSFNIKLTMPSGTRGGEFEGFEMKKIMSNEKLAEIALVDPKRAKRLVKD